jgi:predicted DCC family thiol-disulfide oxidoreductase YuxK
MEAGSPVILYDGVCGLCNRLNRFVLAHDRRGEFRFASLQSPLASETLSRYGRDPRDLDTVYVVLDFRQPGERLLQRSEAILYILRRMGGYWGGIGAVLAAWPRGVADFAYRLVARNRYTLFGKYDACPLPSAEEKARFLDV